MTLNVAKSSSQANYCKYAVKNIFTDTLWGLTLSCSNVRLLFPTILFAFKKKKKKSTIDCLYPFQRKVNKFPVPSKHFPLNITLCSSLNFSICSLDEKLISLDTDLHFKIRLGTRAKEEKVNFTFISCVKYAKPLQKAFT